MTDHAWIVELFDANGDPVAWLGPRGWVNARWERHDWGSEHEARAALTRHLHRQHTAQGMRAIARAADPNPPSITPRRIERTTADVLADLVQLEYDRDEAVRRHAGEMDDAANRARALLDELEVLSVPASVIDGERVYDTATGGL